MANIKRLKTHQPYLDAMNQMMRDLGSCDDELERMIESRCVGIFYLLGNLIVGIAVVEQVSLILIF